MMEKYFFFQEGPYSMIQFTVYDDLLWCDGPTQEGPYSMIQFTVYDDLLWCDGPSLENRILSVVVLDTHMHWRPCLEVYLNDHTNRVCLGIIINQYSIQHDDNLITLSSIPGKLFLNKRRRAGTK